MAKYMSTTAAVTKCLCLNSVKTEHERAEQVWQEAGVNGWGAVEFYSESWIVAAINNSCHKHIQVW